MLVNLSPLTCHDFHHVLLVKIWYSCLKYKVNSQWSRPENLLDTEDLLINKAVLEQMDFFPSFSAFYRFAMNFLWSGGRRRTFKWNWVVITLKFSMCVYGVTLMDSWVLLIYPSIVLREWNLTEAWLQLHIVLLLGFFCTNKVGEAGWLKVFAIKLWLSSGSICERVGFSDLIDLKGESVMPDIC